MDLISIQHDPIAEATGHFQGRGMVGRRAIPELACPVPPPAIRPPVLPDAAGMFPVGPHHEPIAEATGHEGGGGGVGSAAIPILPFVVDASAISLFVDGVTQRFLQKRP